MAQVLSPQQVALDPEGRLSGWLGDVDPRLRIVAASLFALVVVGCGSLPVLALAFGLSLALLLGSRLPIGRMLKRMAAMDGFILFTLAILPFSVPGDAIFTLWGFDATWQGLALAVEIALTANAVVLALLVLVGTMEPVALGHALYALRMPAGLVQLMMFSIRYIDVLRAEYLRLRVAMKVRGFRPGTNRHSYRSMGYLVGMMLVRAVERSERIMDAMKCRGFTGQIHLYRAYRLRGLDAVFAGGSLVAMSLLVVMELVL